MAILNFNAQQYEADAGVLDPIPAAWYNAAVDQSDIKPTKAGDGHYLAIRFTVLDGEFANRKIFSNFNIHNASPVAQEIAYKQLTALTQAVGLTFVADSQELHGRPLKIKVGIESKDGFDPRNIVRAYRNISENIPTGPQPFPGAQAFPGAAQMPQAPLAPQQPQFQAQQPQPWQQQAQQAPQQAQPWQQQAQQAPLAPQPQPWQQAPQGGTYSVEHWQQAQQQSQQAAQQQAQAYAAQQPAQQEAQQAYAAAQPQQQIAQPAQQVAAVLQAAPAQAAAWTPPAGGNGQQQPPWLAGRK